MQRWAWVGVVGVALGVAGCGGGGSDATVAVTAGGDARSTVAQAAPTGEQAPAVDASAAGQSVTKADGGGGGLRPLAAGAFPRDATFTIVAAAPGNHLLRLDLAGLRYEMLNDVGSSSSGSLLPDPAEPGAYAMSKGQQQRAGMLYVRGDAVVGNFPFAQTVPGAPSSSVEPFAGVLKWQQDAARIDGVYNRFDYIRNAAGTIDFGVVQARIFNSGSAMEQCASAQPTPVAACPAASLRRYALMREGDGWRATGETDPSDVWRFGIALVDGEPLWLAGSSAAAGPWTFQIGLPAAPAARTRVRAVGPVSVSGWGVSVGGDGAWKADWQAVPAQQPGLMLTETAVVGFDGLGRTLSNLYVMRGRAMAMSLRLAAWPYPGQMAFGRVDVPRPRPEGGTPSALFDYRAGERAVGRLAVGSATLTIDSSALLAELATPAFAGYLPVELLSAPSGSGTVDRYALHERSSTVGAFDVRWVLEHSRTDDDYYAQVADGFDRAWMPNFSYDGTQFVYETLFARPSGSTRRFAHASIAVDDDSTLAARLTAAGASGYCRSVLTVAGLQSMLLRRELGSTSRCEYVMLDMPATWVAMLAQMNGQGAQGFVPFLSISPPTGRQIYVRDATRTSRFGFYEMPVDFTGLNAAERDTRWLELLNREGALGGRRFLGAAPNGHFDRLPSRVLFMMSWGCDGGALCP